MTTTLQHFGLSEGQIIRKDGNFYLSISRLAQILEVDPRIIRNNLYRNREEYGEITNIKLMTVTGEKDSYLLDEEQIFILCMLMRSSEKAKAFRRTFAKALKMIRSRDFVSISELKSVQLELGFTQEKLIGKQQRISKNRIDRFHHLRAVGLTQKEASRAVRIPFRSAVKLEKAKKLITNSTILLTASKEVLNDN